MGAVYLAHDSQLDRPVALKVPLIAGDDPAEFQAVLGAIYARFLPHKVVAPSGAAEASNLARIVPLLADRPARDGRTTAYICEHFEDMPEVRDWVWSDV